MEFPTLSMYYPELILSTLCFILFLLLLANWSFVGMSLTFLLNLHNLPEKFTELLERSQLGTISVHSSKMDMVATTNPGNVHHVMSKNFWNYPKGPAFQQLFDALGVSLFTLDLEDWKTYRKLIHNYFMHPQTHQFMAKVIPVNIKKGLIPVLEHVSKQEIVVDLEDLFKRNLYDFACIMSTGFNPKTLSVEFPQHPFFKAMDDMCEAIFYRHFMPESLWKLSWVGIGKEKKLNAARDTLREIVTKYVSMKREELKTNKDEEKFDFLQCFLTEHEVFGSVLHPEENIRDNVLGFIFAAQDTTSATLTWFFWLLSENPDVENKIREEMEEKLTAKEGSKWEISSIEEVRKLVYMQATLYETLRLYPPAPFQERIALEHDILPSGHRIKPQTKVQMSSYAMARMTWVWGEDCQEFKPERWISEKGEIKHEPSNKFFAFSAGPRICLGKNMAFTLMKAVAATILYNYSVQVDKTCPVIPAASVILHTKHGLMTRIKSKSA
ncbi:alkane hydroxylase MAH1-like [Pistacia vera]|uniref:alkane hydroxylase MAH1-like n=1 Tax=Pistacia vera TaxID=55513 RepID=UPI0012631FC6|nr:alkane hydroxylase MAH1-like [Pistacia vera]